MYCISVKSASSPGMQLSPFSVSTSPCSSQLKKKEKKKPTQKYSSISKFPNPAALEDLRFILLCITNSKAELIKRNQTR